MKAAGLPGGAAAGRRGGLQGPGGHRGRGRLRRAGHREHPPGHLVQPVLTDGIGTPDPNPRNLVN